MNTLPKIVVIVGPTASGKTDISLKLAKKFNGVVIAADSRQIYEGMNIGSGVPRGDWQRYNGEKVFFVDGIPHYGIGITTPDEPFSAADFKNYAEEKILTILKNKQLPIIVGGTGLYVWALLGNLTLGGAGPNMEKRALLEALPLPELVQRLQKVDPTKYNGVDVNNKRRIVRAIEICEEKQSSKKETVLNEKKYNALQIGLAVPREELLKKIDSRIAEQIQNGFESEAKELYSKYSPDRPSLSGIGYREWRSYFDGEVTWDEAVQRIKIATHQYAKRQTTWFKRDKKIVWFAPHDVLGANTAVEEFLE